MPTENITNYATTIHNNLNYLEQEYETLTSFTERCNYVIMLANLKFVPMLVDVYVEKLFNELITSIRKSIGKPMDYDISVRGEVPLTKKKNTYYRKVEIRRDNFTTTNFPITIKLSVNNKTMSIDFVIDKKYADYLQNDVIKFSMFAEELAQKNVSEKNNPSTSKNWSLFNRNNTKSTKSLEDKKVFYSNTIIDLWEKISSNCAEFHDFYFALEKMLTKLIKREDSNVKCRVVNSTNNSTKYYIYNSIETAYAKIPYICNLIDNEDMPHSNNMNYDDILGQNKYFGTEQKKYASTDKINSPIIYSKKGIQLFCEHYKYECIDNTDSSQQIRLAKVENPNFTHLYLYANSIFSTSIPCHIAVSYMILFSYIDKLPSSVQEKIYAMPLVFKNEDSNKIIIK